MVMGDGDGWGGVITLDLIAHYINCKCSPVPR